MKVGHLRRTTHRGQTWGLIKAQPSQPQTGFEVRHIKSMGSKVRHRTDLHLTLQLEMVISRCNDDPCLTVRDDTAVCDTRHLYERTHGHTRCLVVSPTAVSSLGPLLLSFSHACEYRILRYCVYLHSIKYRNSEGKLDKDTNTSRYLCKR